MTKIKTKYDNYTNKKLLINKVEDIFKIDNMKFGYVDGLKYAILTIDNEEYITYSKVILKQISKFDYKNVFVVLKEFRVNELSGRKYHMLYCVPEELLWHKKHF